MTRHANVGIALLVGLAVAGPVAAENAWEREVQDRAQIEKLMWTYARALDTLNPDAYAATYTPDGEFRTGGPNATKGRDALKKMISDLKARDVANESKTGKKPPAMFHSSLNHSLEFVDKDHARVRAYYMTAFAGDGPGVAPRIAAVGWESNDLVRVNGQWLIKVRDVAPKD